MPAIGFELKDSISKRTEATGGTVASGHFQDLWS